MVTRQSHAERITTTLGKFTTRSARSGIACASTRLERPEIVQRDWLSEFLFILYGMQFALLKVSRLRAVIDGPNTQENFECIVARGFEQQQPAPLQWS